MISSMPPASTSSGQRVEAERIRPDAVDRRKPAVQHEVRTPVTAGVFDCENVGGRLDDAKRLVLASHVLADAAQVAVR